MERYAKIVEDKNVIWEVASPMLRVEWEIWPIKSTQLLTFRLSMGLAIYDLVDVFNRFISSFAVYINLLIQICYLLL